jgi:MarR family transcriptional regulator, organic hydroperoxide resistance regulator
MKTNSTYINILETTASDLLNIPPLIFRMVRRQLYESALTDNEFHISPRNFEILMLLDEGGMLHIAEIGERLRIAKAQMTQLIDNLVKFGLIEKRPDIADRRVSNIMITKHGRSVLNEHKGRILRAMKESLSALTERELKDVSDSLCKLRNILIRK